MNKLQEVTAEAAKEVVAALKEVGIDASKCAFRAECRCVFVTGPKLKGGVYLDFATFSKNRIVMRGETLGSAQLSGVVKSLKGYVDAALSIFGAKGAGLYVDLERSYIYTSNDLVLPINAEDLKGLNWLQGK